jgi:hypothetical protein
MKKDTFSVLKGFQRQQAQNQPTSGVVQAVRGQLADILVKGMTTVLHGVKVIGTPAPGMEVALTWDQGVPVASVVTGTAPTQQLAGLITGPQGPTGPMGPTGPQGPAVGNLDGGSPSSAYGGINPINCGGVV